MSEKIKLSLILGTGRINRESEKVAKLIEKKILTKDVECSFIDVKNYPNPFTIPSWEENEITSSLKHSLKESDGFIIVSPEYNHSFPGELKIFLDTFYSEYAKKPLGICGVSDGAIAGARMVEALRLSGIALKMVTINSALYFPNVDKMFNEAGEYKDKDFDRRFDKFFEELYWYAKVLKNGRENYKL